MHPACSQCQLEAYLGIRVEVEGGVYGTLSFLSTEPRATSFSSSDKEVLRLMAQWVGSEIQRQRAAAQMHKLSSALEQTADSVMITDRDGRIEYVNPAFTRTTGYDDEEIRGQTPRILRSDVHGRDFYARLWHTIRSGEPFHAAFVNVRKNGSTYFEEKTITPLKDAQGRITHFISTGRDVTQQRLAEERARQHQAQLAHVCRVSAMGEMATTLAHELNQPLAAIVTYARGGIRWLRTRGDDSHELLGIMDHIATQGEAAGQIIRRARSLLRKDDARYLPTELNAVVREATDLARLETRRKDIALQLDLAGALPPVPADAIQIEQVVLNLVRNAIEAIDGAHPPRREIAVRTGLGANRGVEVAVFDTGPGFAATDTAHLFDPFYTTKPDGLGMGLTISRSIIEAHGGELHAAPNPDGGATFRFVLPATREGIQHDH
jgi:PAS domain S-box-containing protein